MKWIQLLLIVCLFTKCTNPTSKQKNISITQIENGSQISSQELDSQLKNFETRYQNLEKQLYDSVSRIHNDNIDFSTITGGLEANYLKCNDEFDKVMLGFKLAGNYYINFDSSGNDKYYQKAKPLFFSFLGFKNGELAAYFLKLDIKKVHYIEKEWNQISEPDKKDILLYGLLRGFNNGLPDNLKNIVLTNP